MISPCNAEGGCGTLKPIGNQADGSSFMPAQGLPFSQMTNVAPMQSAVSPSPSLGPAVLPTQSGIIASTFPMPGMTGPELIPIPETIPGPPDQPLTQGGGQGSGQGGASGGTSGGVVPEPVLPEAPQFHVPNNPLLPPGYQEFISYENLQYLNGFLRTQIGKYMRVEQLVGSNMIEERYGYLIGVGINYILLQELGTGNVSALDYYNIKYVHIYYTNPSLPVGAQR